MKSEIRSLILSRFFFVEKTDKYLLFDYSFYSFRARIYSIGSYDLKLNKLIGETEIDNLHSVSTLIILICPN